MNVETLDGTSLLDAAFERLSRLSAIAALTFACGGLVGWWFHLAALLHFGTTSTTMKLNTAISIAVLAIGTLASLSRYRAASRWIRTSAGVVALVAIATTLQEPLAIDLGIDMLLATGPDPAPDGAHGRMAGTTALEIILLASALIALGNGPATSLLALSASIPALVAVAGHVYGAEALYGAPGLTRQAFPTSLACVTLGGALLLARPRDGVLSPLATDTIAAASARRMIPIILVIPLLLGWLRLRGQQLGWYGTEFGVAVLAVGSALTLLAVMLYQTNGMVRLERGRDQLLVAATRAEATAAIEHRFRDLVMAAPVGMSLNDATGACTFVNARWQQLAGMSLAGALGDGWRAAIHPDDRRRVSAEWESAAREQRRFELTFRYLGATAAERWVECSAVTLRDESGEVSGYLGVVTDVSERRAALAALERSEVNFRAVVERAPLGFVVLHGPRIAYANPVACAMLGYSGSGDLVGREYLDLIDGDADAIALARERFARVMAGEQLAPRALRMRRRDGTTILVEGSPATMTFDGKPAIGAAMHDVTERERLEVARSAAEAGLRASLLEKEILLQEVHHRVKNNLQIIASLLSLQASSITDPVAKTAFAELRGRVRAIASVHERLYRSPDIAHIDIALYLREFVLDLARALAQPGRAIGVEVDAAPIVLPIEQVVPLALFVNELVTNAFKHAFVAVRAAQGTVRVTLRADGETLVLQVIDDGIGLRSDPPELREGTGIGISLVRGLAQQLGGTVSFASVSGTTCTLRFPAPRAETEIRS